MCWTSWLQNVKRCCSFTDILQHSYWKGTSTGFMLQFVQGRLYSDDLMHENVDISGRFTGFQRSDEMFHGPWIFQCALKPFLSITMTQRYWLNRQVITVKRFIWKNGCRTFEFSRITEGCELCRGADINKEAVTTRCILWYTVRPKSDDHHREVYQTCDDQGLLSLYSFSQNVINKPDGQISYSWQRSCEFLAYLVSFQGKHICIDKAATINGSLYNIVCMKMHKDHMN